MGSFINNIADDVLGFDPNGGGIHSIPVVGDIVDDQLGADPGESPLEQLGSVAATIGAGVGAAGLAGIGPAAGLNTAVFGGAAPVAGTAGTAGGLGAAGAGAGTAATGSTLGSIGSTLGSVGSAAGSLLGGGGGAAGAGGAGGTLGTIGSIGSAIGGVAQGVAGLASGAGALAEVYDAVTGESAERDIALVRQSVPEVANLTDDQIAGQLLARQAANDPRVAQAVDRLYASQGQGAGALSQGLGHLQGVVGGTDAATNRLAGQAAAASQLGASQAGALGSARQSRASQAAAADVLAGRQQSAANTLTSQGAGLLGQGFNAYNLGQAPGTSLRNIGAQQQAQNQAQLNRPALQAQRQIANEVRDPTTAERIGAAAGGLEALPTAIDQAAQGTNQFLSLFR